MNSDHDHTTMLEAPCAKPWTLATKLILAALLACTVGGMAPACAKTPGEVAIGEVLRDAPMLGLNGPARRLSEFRGRPLIINVWASWCGPCREEMPSLERLAWQNQSGQFAVIGISTDDHPEAAKAWLRRSNATINHFIDRNLVLEGMLGASKLPLTVLVDANGKVLDKIYGAKEWDSPAALQLLRRTFRNPKITPVH